MLKVGDVVKLKSGGPDMTVASVYLARDADGTNIRCIWFTGPVQYGARFAEEALVVIKEEPLAKP